MSTSIQQPSRKAHGALAVLLSFFLTMTFGGTAHASVDLANAPLFLTTSVDPNLMFILDDSGSMQWEIMPDGIVYTYYLFPRPSNLYGGSVYDRRIIRFLDSDIVNTYVRSSHNNAVFYNPELNYNPWVDANGNQYIASNPFTAAMHNPALPGLGTVDLSMQQTFDRWRRWTGSAWDNDEETRTFWPITFYQYKNTGSAWSNSSYIKYQIRGTDGYEKDLATGTTTTVTSFNWPNGIIRTVAEEAQNFANWYTFYRSRVLAARAGIGRAFAQQSEDMRVGFGAINVDSKTVDGQISNHAIIQGLRKFSGSDRDSFFENLYEHVIPTYGTPLRRALDAAGKYYSRTDNPGPWGHTPGSDVNKNHLTCRQSYTILMTDGFWNGPSPDIGNADNTEGPVITNPKGDTYKYSPSDPYKDDWSNTLADVAMHYWKRDLRTDMENRVPTSSQNEAFWQHMVTFGVGFGVQGTIDPDDAWAAVNTGTALDPSWPDPAASNPAKLDDLLHAGVNSRGGFFTASDPEAFAEGLSEVLDAIVARVESSATSAAASAAVLQTDTLLYTAGFRSDDWSGTLTAYELTEDGTDSEAWDAEELLAARLPSTRKIFTRAAASSGVGGGVSFETLNDLNVAQQAALNHDPNNVEDNLGQERVDWLRGDEEAHDSFRSRSESGQKRLLGDIIHSDPQYKNDVLYLGANDGMLHAFDAQTGEELFAYIPSPLLLPESGQDHAPLSRLMDPNYLHRYFVDGKAVVAAVNIGGAKTYLVGSMGAGGKTVFALDVTNPGGFSASDVKWEFSHAELGYNVGQPTIVRMSDGTWAAVFGNGYNSASGKAALFVVNLETGTLIKMIETNDQTANGLASPFVTDWPEMNFRAQRIYVGDLLGNLWAFDVSGASNEWTSRLLFEARDANDHPQPITSRPHGARIDSERVMIVFGTGSYFRSPDKADTQVQSLYGIVDHLVPANDPVDRASDLLQQEIIYQGLFDPNDPTSYTVRVLSDYTIDSNDPPKESGWFIDLNTETGERVISGPRTLGHTEQRVRFTTMIPDEDPCGTGRRGFLMDIDLLTGGRTSFSVFDLDGDGEIDAEDMITITINGETLTVPGTGIEFGQGESVTTVNLPDSDLQLLIPGDGGDGRPPPVGLGEGITGGRQSWRQLR